MLQDVIGNTALEEAAETLNRTIGHDNDREVLTFFNDDGCGVANFRVSANDFYACAFDSGLGFNDGLGRSAQIVFSWGDRD